MNSLQLSGTFFSYIARFLFFLVVVNWPLGSFVLKICRIRLSSWLEYVAISSLLGTLSWTFLYFFLRWFHFDYLLFPFATIFAVVWMILALQRFKNPIALTKPFETQTELVFVLSMLLFFLYWFVSSWGGITWTPEGGLILSKKLYSDHIWHLSVSSELEHSVPPDIPVLAGHRLAYHYFSGLFVVFINEFTKIDLINLQYYFTPAYTYFIFSVLIFAGLKRILANEKLALLGFLFTMLSPTATDLSLRIHLPIAGSIFFTIIILLSDHFSIRQKGSLLLVIFLLSQLMMYETLLSISLIGSLMIGSSIIWLKQKNKGPFIAVSLGALLAVAVEIFATGKLGGGRDVIKFDFPFFIQAAIDSPQAKSIIKTLLSEFKSESFTFKSLLFTKGAEVAVLPIVLIYAFIISVIKHFQFGLIAILTVINKIKNISREKIGSVLFYPCLLIGFLLPLIASIASYSGASFRLLDFSIFLIYAVAAVPIYSLWQGSIGKKMIVLGFVAVFLIYPNFVSRKTQLSNSVYYTRRTPEEMEVFGYLRAKTPPDSIIMHPFLDDPVLDPRLGHGVGWIFEDHYYYGSALGGRRVVLEGSKNGPAIQMVPINAEQIAEIRNDIKRVFAISDQAEAIKLLRKYNVTYLWVPHSQKIRFKPQPFLTAVIENQKHTLYKIS